MRAASASVKAAGAYGREGSRRTTASSATRPVGTCRFRMSALSQRGGAGVASIPKVVGDEAAQDVPVMPAGTVMVVVVAVVSIAMQGKHVGGWIAHRFRERPAAEGAERPADARAGGPLRARRRAGVYRRRARGDAA